MSVRRIISIVLAFAILLSTGVAPVAADHNEDIAEWIDSVAQNNDYYGVQDPLLYFSGDRDPHAGGNLDQTFDNESTATDFYKSGDFSFTDYPVGVTQWNQGNFWQDYRHGGRSTAQVPGPVRENTKDSDRLKDGFATFFSIDPSTVVHTYPSGEEMDQTEYRVGQTGDVNVLLGSRVKMPAGGILDGVLKTKHIYRVEEYKVDYTRLYLSNCGMGYSCKVAEDTSGRHKVQFNNVDFRESGSQRMTVRAKFSVKINHSIETRNWKCDPIKLPKIDLDGDGDKEEQDRGDKPDEGEDGGEKGWDCYWTDWEYSHTNILEDQLFVEDEIGMTVEQPEATAKKAVLPHGYEEYYIEGLDNAEWSKITYNDGGREELAVKSTWRYFSSRDKRWDLYCETDGGRDGAIFEPCGGTLSDPTHTDARARPLLTHSFPMANLSEIQTGRNTFMQDMPSIRTTTRPNLKDHSSCDGNCRWNVRTYEDIGDNHTYYSEPSSMVIRRTNNETESLRLYGLVNNNPNEVEITDTREVKLALLDYEIVQRGSEISDTHRAIAESNGIRLPDEDEVEIEVQLYESGTGEPISLKDRENEKLIIKGAGDTYYAQTGSDGTVRLIVEKTDGSYAISYDNREWYNTPEDEQAYITRSDLYATTGSAPPGAVLQALFNFLVVFGVPFICLYYFARALGIDLDPRQWM